jgi:hypothetical protein
MIVSGYRREMRTALQISPLKIDNVRRGFQSDIETEDATVSADLTFFPM